MFKAAGGTNHNGYLTALDKGFCGVDESGDIPTPSAFSQFRKTISFDFFKDIFKETINSWEQVRPKWKGLFLNAIDGDQLNLPLSDGILDDGYRGYPVKENKETYFPVMYSCWATDLITGVPVGFSFSNKNDEISRAYEIHSEYDQPDTTLTIYDRFYLSARLLKAYQELGGYFIARCKSESTFSVVVEFGQSKRKESIVEIDEVKYRLIKYTPANSEEEIILATNLPARYKKKDISPLYGYRWESETGNRDRTSTLKIDQFRAQDLNGIIQEIYSTLILQSISRIICAVETNPKKDFLKTEYKKANFKATAIKIVDNIGCLMKKTSQTILKEIQRLIIASVEKRLRYTRYFDRIVRRSAGKLYDHKSTVPRRKK